MKKKITALALVICLMATAVVGATLAYFTDSDEATNTFSIGNVSIMLEEETSHLDGADKPKNSDGFTYTNVMPGDKMNKEVTVTNNGSSPAYVALAIQHEHYAWDIREGVKGTNGFNAQIDDYYEGLFNKGEVEKLKAMGIPEEYLSSEETLMQNITDDIFSGADWKLVYDKYTHSRDHVNFRYLPSWDKVPRADQTGLTDYRNSDIDKATIIAIDYRTPTNEHSTVDKNYNMMDKGTYLPNGSQDTDEYARMWVYYLYMPAGASYTMDLSVTCPTYIDDYSILAFHKMAIDIRATAIQVDGFSNAKAAFTELAKAYPFDF